MVKPYIDMNAELRKASKNRIKYLEDVEDESLQIIDNFHIELDKLKNKNFFLRDDNKKLRKSINLIKKK